MCARSAASTMANSGSKPGKRSVGADRVGRHGGRFCARAPIAGALQALQELDDVTRDPARRPHRSHRTSSSTRLLARRALAARARAARAPRHRRGARRHRHGRQADVAVRGKPNSSDVVGLKLQADGAPTASSPPATPARRWPAPLLCSACTQGSSGRPSPRSSRPPRKPIVVLDSGANVDCSAAELVQFAWLGVGLRRIRSRPRESGRRTAQHWRRAGEGQCRRRRRRTLCSQRRDSTFRGTSKDATCPRGATDRGPIDVVVCDGFVGNVVLKFYEARHADDRRAAAARRRARRDDDEARLRPLDYSSMAARRCSACRASASSVTATHRRGRSRTRSASRYAPSRSRMNEHIGERLAPRSRQRRQGSMKRPIAAVVGTGRGIPEHVMTNHDFAAIGIETSHEWIVERSGIVERHIARDGETTCSMAADGRTQGDGARRCPRRAARRDRAEHRDARPSSSSPRPSTFRRSSARRAPRHSTSEPPARAGCMR